MSIDYNPADRPPPRDQTSDTDRDGITDWREYYELGTDPWQPDTDLDGLRDSDELAIGTDPTDWDTDSDGLSDGHEVYQDLDPGGSAEDGTLGTKQATDPLAWDSDGDGWSDGLEERYVHTDPNSRDTDRDGLSDRDEGMVYRTDPNKADSDDDGLRDGSEVRHGSNPNSSDSDGDGTADGVEGMLASQYRWSADSLLASTVTTSGAASAVFASPRLAADPEFDELGVLDAGAGGPSLSELAVDQGLEVDQGLAVDPGLAELGSLVAHQEFDFGAGAASAGAASADPVTDVGAGAPGWEPVDQAGQPEPEVEVVAAEPVEVVELEPEPEPEPDTGGDKPAEQASAGQPDAD